MPARLVACVSAAQVCVQIGAYTWPALWPAFLAEWRLTNRDAGWITGIFYAAYTVSVPVLVTLTGAARSRRRSAARGGAAGGSRLTRRPGPVEHRVPRAMARPGGHRSMPIRRNILAAATTTTGLDRLSAGA